MPVSGDRQELETAIAVARMLDCGHLIFRPYGVSGPLHQIRGHLPRSPRQSSNFVRSSVGRQCFRWVSY